MTLPELVRHRHIRLLGQPPQDCRLEGLLGRRLVLGLLRRGRGGLVMISDGEEVEDLWMAGGSGGDLGDGW